MTAPAVQDLFETPLIVDSLPGASALNGQLAGLIRAKRSADPGVRKSNWLGWQSRGDMLDWGGPAAIVIRDHFLDLCDRYTACAPGEQPNFLWSVDMWANVSPAGASNEAHVHPGSVWSAVYYVVTGQEEDVAGQGGDLVLYDPRMPASRMLPFDLRYRRADGQIYQSLHAHQPKPGEIVMFPPWLLHSVHPHRGKGERISIAMNATAIAA